MADPTAFWDEASIAHTGLLEATQAEAQQVIMNNLATFREKMRESEA